MQRRARSSGWGWNETKGVPEHIVDIMDACFNKYPKRRLFRDAPPKFKGLFEILVVETGRAARPISKRIRSLE
jgi:hypothetical protein